MKFDAVLFDLDGTLTDTLADIAFAMNRSLRLHGLPQWPEEAYRYLVGDGAKVLSERAVRQRHELAPSVRREYQAYYQEHTLDRTKPYDGICAMLSQLQDMGLKLAVLSNKPDRDTRGVVAHFFPEIRFVRVRGQVEGVPVKPDPAGALQLAQEIGVVPERILYLGDTSVDMRCALAAGMFPVGALWGFRDEAELRQSGARALAAKPSDVVELARDVTNL